MTRRIYILSTVLITILFSIITTKAQSINSVYTMFGIGQLSDNNLGINRGLGGTGIAFKSGRSVNYLNPASYLGLQPRSYILETGAFGVINNAKSGNQTNSFSNINFGYFSVSFYLTDWWAFKLRAYSIQFNRL